MIFLRALKRRRRHRAWLKSIERDLEAVPFDRAMLTLRRLAYSGYEDADVLRVVSERAVRAADNGEDRRHAQRWAAVYRAGRVVRARTAKIVALNTDPAIDIRTVAEIEDALSTVNIENEE